MESLPLIRPETRLLYAQAGPRPVLSGRPNGTKVVVLGAGVSGMAVGYELGKLGYSCQVIEARPLPKKASVMYAMIRAGVST